MDQKPKKKKKKTLYIIIQTIICQKLEKKPKKNTKKLPFFIQKNIKIFFCLGTVFGTVAKTKLIKMF